MDFGVLIEISIGLMLMFLVLSLFATAIIESISQLFALRARNLRRALAELLSEQNVADGSKLSQAFKNHPLSVITEKMEISGWWFGSSRVGPSYIDKESFLSTLRAVAAGGQAVANIGEAIDKLPDGDLKTALQALRAEAVSSGTKLEETLGKWFDSMMERASGVFKRWMRMLSIVVGFVIALAVNADTVEISQRLANDPEARAKIVEIARKRVECQEKHGADAKECKNLDTLRADIKTVTVGWTKESWADVWKDDNVWMKIIGLVLTGFAVALGAPFWFDLLSKAMGIRIKASGEDVDKQRSGQQK